jgi:hypothetical protein
MEALHTDAPCCIIISDISDIFFMYGILESESDYWKFHVNQFFSSAYADSNLSNVPYIRYSILAYLKDSKYARQGRAVV